MEEYMNDGYYVLTAAYLTRVKEAPEKCILTGYRIEEIPEEMKIPGLFPPEVIGSRLEVEIWNDCSMVGVLPQDEEKFEAETEELEIVVEKSEGRFYPHQWGDGSFGLFEVFETRGEAEDEIDC